MKCVKQNYFKTVRDSFPCSGLSKHVKKEPKYLLLYLMENYTVKIKPNI